MKEEGHGFACQEMKELKKKQQKKKQYNIMFEILKFFRVFSLAFVYRRCPILHPRAV